MTNIEEDLTRAVTEATEVYNSLNLEQDFQKNIHSSSYTEDEDLVEDQSAYHLHEISTVLISINDYSSERIAAGNILPEINDKICIYRKLDRPYYIGYVDLINANGKHVIIYDDEKRIYLQLSNNN